ncbi:MAG TPA: universal stress protein [Candidatus Limnocylindrales bacterium]|jgi:nucleotide-binding universal stress UspA family protein
MRVIVAYDASDEADQALALVTRVPWPKGSEIDVLTVVEPTVTRMPSAPVPTFVDSRLDELIASQLEESTNRAAERLRDSGLSAEATLAWGRPATVLTDAVLATQADLVVVGSRGRGAIASLVLGSVSAELVDHAACPVLVARGSDMKRVLVATDGSSTAALALQVIGQWPIFNQSEARVLSVADVPRPLTLDVAPESQMALDAWSHDLAETERQHREIAARAAEQLSAAGRKGEPTVRTGDAAAEIIEEARSWKADLIVVGSRGQTGLQRLLLGSVARNVLLGADASVLVVRQGSLDNEPRHGRHC